MYTIAVRTARLERSRVISSNIMIRKKADVSAEESSTAKCGYTIL